MKCKAKKRIILTDYEFFNTAIRKKDVFMALPYYCGPALPASCFLHSLRNLPALFDDGLDALIVHVRA